MFIPCPSCQQPVDRATASTCPHCGWPFNPQGGFAVQSLVRPAPRPKIQAEIDLGVTVDRTGSSNEFSTGIPLTFETIVKQVAAKARSVRCWLQSHGDLDLHEQITLLTNGGTPDQAIADIKRIAYGGGGDPPEHHLDAIEHLVSTVPWTADPARGRGAMLAFMTADSKPARSGTTARQLGEVIKQQALLLYLVCQPTPTLYELVQAASGMMFEISNSPDPADLQKIAMQLSASIVATVAKGGTVPMTA